MFPPAIKSTTDLPPYLENVHRCIRSNASFTCFEIRSFLKDYFTPGVLDFDYSQCATFLAEVFIAWNIQVDDVTSWKDFVEVQNTKNTGVAEKHSPDMQNLLLICERAKHFENVVVRARRRMKYVYERAHASFKSFQDYAQSLELKPVLDYERDIQKYRVDAESKMDSINKNVFMYGELKNPFMKFIQEGRDHSSIMKKSCDLFIEVCQIIQEWVKEDALYPEKLWQHILHNTTVRDQFLKDLKELEKRRDCFIEMLSKKLKLQVKLLEYYWINRKEKQRLNASKSVVLKRIDRLKLNVPQAESEMEQLLSKKMSIKSLNQQKFLGFSLQQAVNRVNNLKQQVQVMRRQYQRLERDQKELYERTYEIKMDVLTNRQQQRELEEKVQSVEAELQLTAVNVNHINIKTNLLKVIRNIKLSTDTFRKLRPRKSYNKKKVFLEDACKFVARYIGADWKKLYEKLPIIPPRAATKRQMDVETIDLVAAKHDQTNEQQALNCLEKWRVFHRQGQVVHLVKGLQKISKMDLANQLKAHFTSENI